MKTIRISDYSYKFLKRLSVKEKRPLTKTLDLFVEIFKGVDNGLAHKGLPNEKGEKF